MGRHDTTLESRFTGSVISFRTHTHIHTKGGNKTKKKRIRRAKLNQKKRRAISLDVVLSEASAGFLDLYPLSIRDTPIPARLPASDISSTARVYAPASPAIAARSWRGRKTQTTRTKKKEKPKTNTISFLFLFFDSKEASSLRHMMWCNKRGKGVVPPLPHPVKQRA